MARKNRLPTEKRGYCTRCSAAKAEKPAKPPAAPEKTASAESSDAPGPTAFVQVEGNHFNMGDVLTYDFDIGYKVNSHTSADIGLPLYSTRTPFPIVAGHDWRDTTILGRRISTFATIPSTTGRTSPPC
jgi:hypothetical protein